jgi:predicted transposase/invertase (TIGR01784 family)
MKFILIAIFSIALCGGNLNYATAAGFLAIDFHKTIRLTAPLITRTLTSQAHTFVSHPPITSQVYGVATYDALFKSVMDDASVRPSFFHAFIPDIKVVESERLDDHMNPLQEFQLIREILNKKKTKETVTSLRDAFEYNLMVKKMENEDFRLHTKGTQLLQSLLTHFEDLVKGFPKKRHDGSMDFVCRLDTGEYALIETQVIRQDYWDKRALAYVAAFYGNQLRSGGEWKDIKKVIGINILGGGVDEHKHWPDAPDQFMRHYMFQEQMHKPLRFIEELQLFQYSITNTPKEPMSQEQKDWITFLKDGYKMTEVQVAKIQTEAVRKAFERAQFSKMTTTQREAYENEDVRYKRISGLIAETKQEGKAEGLAEGEFKTKRAIALVMLADKEPSDKILKYSRLTPEELAELKAAQPK